MSSFINLIQQFVEYLFGLTQSFGFPSYALAIILLTIIVKVLLYPLMRKQMQSMATLNKLQPKIAAIDRKYGKNPAKKNEALVKLYQQNNINPMAGCLPLLIQLPIFVCLYRALLNFEYTGGFDSFYWIEHIGNPDPTGIYLPVLVGLSTYAQQKIMITNKNDRMQNTMLYVMPIMLGFMAIRFPAGLCLYWITYSIIGTLQQLAVNHGSLFGAVKHYMDKNNGNAEAEKEDAETDKTNKADKTNKTGNQKKTEKKQGKQNKSVEKQEEPAQQPEELEHPDQQDEA
ncbi:MAG: YidC/Oxa1 family membrane protein insertase [Peptococcaceae bacterium]|nr:YidC/Oxa1 family membrane protein insertase [Peptococcaceae bacterium]